MDCRKKNRTLLFQISDVGSNPVREFGVQDFWRVLGLGRQTRVQKGSNFGFSIFGFE